VTAKLYEDLDIDAYHAYSDIKTLGDEAVLSKSMLAIFDDCPAKFEDQFIHGNRPAPTDEMNLGNAVHMYALQKDLFDAKFYEMPLKEDGKQIIRNATHAAYKEQLAIAAGRTIVQPSELAHIKGMAGSLAQNRKALHLLDKPGKVEASIFWTDADTGLKFRCRPDFIGNDGVLVDLKTTGRADNRGFEKIAFGKRYDLSVALTARGWKALTGEYPKEYAFLLVETCSPYIVEGKLTFVDCNYNGGALTKSYWQIGEERLSRLLDRYLQCRESGFYPGYNVDIMPMTAPDYEVYQLYHVDDEISV
jgi:hypothetical protein